MSLPPLDICKLEVAGVGCGVDMNEVWHVVCKLSDETDNIRISGNPLFDGRYLNYENRSNHTDNTFYDRDSKVKGDWRTHFFTRTAQILLNSSDPQRLPNAPVHSERCDCVRPEIPERDLVELGCDCWGHGIDPTHQVFLQRLMTIPPHSNIAKTFCKMEQRSAHFEDTVDLQHGDLLLVPFRYAKYFASDANTNVFDLLSILVNGCQFRPKLLPVHCEFFFYSELYQLFLSVEKDGDKARNLFTEFLSDLESVEFYWIGGLRGPSADGEMSFQANPSMHIPRLFLETVLNSSSPNLDTMCIRMYGSSHHFAYDMPSIDGCLNDIAPLLSSSSTDESNSKCLPINAPYKGLRKLHIFGEIKEKASRDTISSIILHQIVVEGLEIRCNSKIISPGNVLDPIYHILMQPSIQFLVVTKWQDYNFKDLFCKFLDANADCEINFATWTDEVVIPARSQTSDLAHRKKFLCFLTGDFIFSWLNEAKVDVPLRSVTMKSSIATLGNEQCFLSFLDTCQALTLQVKGGGSFPFLGCFDKLSCNGNLKVLRVHGCLPFMSLVDSFCAMLSAVYINCAGSLTELSLLNNRIGSLPPDKLELFFKTLISFANLGQLSVNLRGNALKDAALDVLLKVWRATKTRPEFKSILLDSSEQEERVAEMVLEW